MSTEPKDWNEYVSRYGRLLARHLQIAETEQEFRWLIWTLEDVVIGTRAMTLVEAAKRLTREGRPKAARYMGERADEALAEMEAHSKKLHAEIERHAKHS